jgi:hypothetical protein
MEVEASDGASVEGFDVDGAVVLSAFRSSNPEYIGED